MTKSELIKKNIKDADAKKLSGGQIKKYLKLFEYWDVNDEGKLATNFELTNFSEVMQLFEKVGNVAEEEGHHPDFYIYDYKNMMILLATHEAKGLTEKDFIMAAKIDSLFEEKKSDS